MTPMVKVLDCDEGWIDLEITGDIEGHWEANVREDGCVNLRKFWRKGEPLDHISAAGKDYIHICKLEEAIARLEAIRATARLKWGETWGT